MVQHEDSEGLGQLNEVEVLLAVPHFFSDLKCQTLIPVENLDYSMNEHDLEECFIEKSKLCSPDFQKFQGDKESSDSMGTEVDLCTDRFFDYSQTLSLLQSTAVNLTPKKMPKVRGRKSKRAITREEVEAGFQSTLDGKFSILTRSTRREKYSPCQT